MSKTNNYLTISEPLSKSMMIEMSQEPDLPGYISIYSNRINPFALVASYLLLMSYSSRSKASVEKASL